MAATERNNQGNMYVNWWLDKGLNVLVNPQYSKYIAPALLVMDAVLCGLIIRTVAYTEIDWRAYMQQVEQFAAGEHDYAMLKGDTGPLVYPALHVYIYRVLYALTQEGTNIVLAQAYFAALYVFNLGLVMLCYHAAEAPPYIYPLLVLSKRLHSIYVLRCFNDGFAMTGLWLMIYFYQRKRWTLGTIFFTLGLAVKMNLLLVLPAVAVILFQGIGTGKALSLAYLVLQVQAALAVPFLKRNWRSYLTRAFDFSREFKYEWTVNWKFFTEETFLSKEFSYSLLAGHAAFLLLFIFTRWLQPLYSVKGNVVQHLLELPPSKDEPEEVQELKKSNQRKLTEQLTPEFILTTVLGANTIGMLFARSLHFQFFSWIGWASPFLLWRSGLHPLLLVLVWFGQELAWNHFPPDSLSSKIVVSVLAATVFKLWVNTDDKPDPQAVFRAVKEAQYKSQQRGPAKAAAKQE